MTAVTIAQVRAAAAEIEQEAKAAGIIQDDEKLWLTQPVGDVGFRLKIESENGSRRVPFPFHPSKDGAKEAALRCIETAREWIRENYPLTVDAVSAVIEQYAIEETDEEFDLRQAVALDEPLTEEQNADALIAALALCDALEADNVSLRESLTEAEKAAEKAAVDLSGVLECLSVESWSPDTLDQIATWLINRGVAVVDGNGFFTAK